MTKETPARRFPRLHIRIQAQAFTQSALPAKGAQGVGIIPQAVPLFAACVGARDSVVAPSSRPSGRRGTRYIWSHISTRPAIETPSALNARLFFSADLWSGDGLDLLAEHAHLRRFWTPVNL